MLHLKTKTEILLERLQARLNHINLVGQSLKMIEHARRDYKRIHQEVSFYVHSIMSSVETRDLYVGLVNYKNSLNKNPEYIQLMDAIEENVARTARLILDHPDYDLFKSTTKGHYYNPVLSLPDTSMPVDDLLKSLLTFKTSNANYDNFFFSTAGVLSTICQGLYSVAKSDLEGIPSSIEEYYKKLDQFEYLTDFNYDFNGSASASTMALIYSEFNPTLKFNGSIYQNILKDNISKGKGIGGEDSLETILNDCDKVFQFIKEQLNTKLSIESAVDRFLTYMSLYYEGNFRTNNAEVDLQKKFQEFIFNAGYYPISEAEISNGRLDTIANSHVDAFLFELKQCDLGKTKETDRDFSNKLKSAQVQSSIYVDRLKTFPNLAHFVFIILFTNRKITFKDSIDRVLKDGITYILKVVTIYDQRPSEVKTDIQVNAADLILNN
jgi:hypothetical protein